MILNSSDRMIDRRPTVCQLLHTLNVGGAEILAGNLARRLRDRYRFVFFCLDEAGVGAESLFADGFTVEVVGRRSGLDLRCALKLASRLRHHDVQLIQAHQYTPFFYSSISRLRYRKPPIIFTEHGRHHPDHPRWKRKVANRVLIERRDRVVAVGRSVRDALVANEGIPTRRIEVIPNGIDTDRFRPSTEVREVVRRDLRVGDDYLVMMVARLDPIKDHLTAIRAVQRARSVLPNLKLMIVGDGPQRGAIESFIRQERMLEHVVLLGTRSDVPRLLNGADTLLLTSISEGIPLTVIEAMATGVPIVSTNVGSLSDVVTHGSNGFLSGVGDDEALGTHMVELGRSMELRHTMGESNRTKAVSDFSEITMAERYAELFDDRIRQC
jgi:glycosyltransferase involved in cell wall biosynthesis